MAGTSPAMTIEDYPVTFDDISAQQNERQCRGYRTTPEMNPGLRRGGLISFFRKQRASRPT
jgi:hypothetical protein